jgi:hypothetical protein
MSATWILTGLSLFGAFLNIKKHRACFWIWAFTNASWAIVDFWYGLYSQGVLFSIYFILAVYGWYSWKQ